ncbi:MAG: metallophosphoesterase, partial [Verrucomicrobiota bacterium]
MNGLTWLHLSDWHQKGRDFDRSVVRDDLIRDLRERTKIDAALGQVDFVIFSGDVAWQGEAEEFQSARECLFDPMLKELGLLPSQLFIVPGNHDFSREVVEEMLPEALKKPLETDEQVQKWLTDDKRRNRALEPFEAFAGFVSGFTGQKPAAYANTRSQFVGTKTVGILCLNSAWMCGRNRDPKGEVNDYGFLTLGEPQLHEALSTIQSADVRLAVLHHPFPWLAEFDRNHIEERLKRDCHFILHGHEHQPRFNLGRELSGECAVVPAGACYERRTAKDPRYTNAYNFVHLDFETGQGVIFLRRWSDRRNAWIEDTDSHDGGKFPFPLPKELGKPKAPMTRAIPQPSPAASATSLSPAVLEYLRRIEAATSKLQLIGLGQGVPIELPIQQAYIPLNVVVARDLMNEAQFHYDAKALGQREHVEEDVLLCDMFKWAVRFDSRGVLLLGDPGAGKTTGARQFCWRVLNEDDLPKALGLPAGTLPVFLRLRYLTPHHLGKGLSAFITDSVAASTLPPDLANPGPDLLARRGVLWIFDGLDEVVNENARVHVCDWIKEALADRLDDFFLVTSRYQGYQGRVDLGPAF